MKYIEVELTSGRNLTIFFNNNIAVLDHKSKVRNENYTTVLDGLHNNGGWEVNESYEEVIEKIKKAKSI